MTWEFCIIFLQLVTLCVLGWVVCMYIRVKRFINIARQKMPDQMDKLIDGLLDEQPALQEPARKNEFTDTQKHRERLVSLVVGGQAQQYLGKTVSADHIDAIDDGEVEKLYARYEAKLGAAMIKTLGRNMLQLYSTVVSTFLPIPPENQTMLVSDLEADPFVEHALSTSTCELYHRYGMYLAPLTAALTTTKYCQFGHKNVDSINNGGESNTRTEGECSHASDSPSATKES